MFTARLATRKLVCSVFRAQEDLTNRYSKLGRRGLATVSDAPLSRKVEQNNWEEGHYINYKKMSENLSVVRSRLNRPLTYAEKVDILVLRI